MEVILTQDIPSLGKAGNLVKVRDGFGRNYLLPQKKAMLADSKNKQIVERQKKNAEAQAAKVRGEAEAFAAKLKDVSVTVSKEAGRGGERLFGSVTKMDILVALREKDLKLEKHWIELEAPIKAAGDYEIPVRFHPEVTATLKLSVTAKS